MNEFNIFNVLFDFFQVIVNLSTNAYNFLFQEISVLGLEFQLFYVLGGGLFTVLMVAWLVRRFI